MKYEVLMRKYAKLLVEMGLNVQKGQRMAINAPVECADFVRMCADAAYAIGCREVIVRWTDDYLNRQKYLYGDNDIFDSVNPWETALYNDVSAEGAAWLAIHSSDPEALKGVDSGRLQRASLALGKDLKTFRTRERNNFFPWCVASVPSKAWAKKVFPNATEEQAIDLLWQAIFSAVRVNEKDDPVALWHGHIDSMSLRKQKLNDYNFAKLHYTNSIGTDLMVGLPENHVWEGGSELTQKGRLPFCANMPTEEIFSAPHRTGTNGVVVSAMPLVLSGNIVRDFKLTLKDGKIVKAEAAEGLEFLESELNMDDGARYLGEVALVPVNSPIAESGILFYNTLFDENAACHFAFGDAYPCVKNGDTMTRSQLDDAGLNSSMTHVDFMVGTSDLAIVGIQHDGTAVDVFKNGKFVF